MNISFKVTTEERAIIAKIAERAIITARKQGITLERMGTEMDLTAAHANGNPLRLAGLLEADDFNFTHDVFGIIRHIDRDTGKIGGFFSPRFTATPSNVEG